MRFYVLVILLMAGFAAAAEMNAALIQTGTLGGTNCRGQGGPTYYEVSATITNPSYTKPMRITYMYYNSSSGELEDGGKVCDIKAGAIDSCEFKVYTITGGENGTDTIPFKIIGWIGDLCGENTYCAGAQEYETTLSVAINHYTSMNEEYIMNKIGFATSEYARVSMQNYSGNCYNTSGFSLLQDAQTNITNANATLVMCDLTHSLNESNDAINKIHQAEGYSQPVSCVTPPPVENKTNNTPPRGNNSTVVPPSLNKTPGGTNATQNLTNMTSTLMKGCLPFYILAALFLVGVRKERANA